MYDTAVNVERAMKERNNSAISYGESREAGTSGKIIIPSNHIRGHEGISPTTLP